MNKNAKLWLIGIISSISFLILCTGCNVEFQERTGFPFEEVLVIKADLSNKWKWEFNEWIEGNVYAVKYSAGEGILLTHQVGVFPGKQTAESAYNEWEEKWFAGGWQPRPEAQFTPNDSQDQYRYECIDMIDNGRPVVWCRHLQQHDKLVSLVLINIDDESITFDEFNNLLQVIDDKLNAVQ